MAVVAIVAVVTAIAVALVVRISLGSHIRRDCYC